MRIKGYFGNMKNANETVEKLQNAGFNQAFIDMNDDYTDAWNNEINTPGTATAPSLSAMVLKSDAHSVERRLAPMAAASPMVSGMGRFEEIADISCTVVVDVNGVNADKALQIIQEMGGDLDNPNISSPKMTDDTDLFLEKTIDQTTDINV